MSSAGKAKVPNKLVASRYELKGLLGEGGMGLVYRAVDTRTGGFVAIKTMRDLSDPRTVEMFKKEWRVLARLSHPNIVDIRDVDEIEEDGIRKPCFVMPLLPGVTLATLIKDSGHRLTVERSVGMLCQVCNGLEAAHRAELVHRDLKPSNIFVMEDDTAKIIDFGLVYSADAKSATGHKGTWQYMAPEQVEGKTPTVLSDIFSLGVVAYEALTARKPFARTTVEATAEAVRTCIPPTISEINPKVSQLLSKVVHKAIAKQPMHRYASAREFAENLQKAYHNLPIERFDKSRILPRIERARRAFEKDDCAFASEILMELEAEGNVDAEITLLRAQIEEAVKEKRIRQLFEGAQTRLEQDEIPLALDKLREILELDPENADALSMRHRIEEQRNSLQISDWLSLARQHLKLQDFAEARQALKEVLNIRYDDSAARQLLADVDVREKEATKARAEKEQLYGSALRAYQIGEISTALSKLEKILEVSRRTPGATIPERDAVYQSFYNRVRSEQDTIDKAYDDSRRLLNEKAFQKALEICDQMLSQYPGSAQFHALKLKVEQAERQELSAYIAEVGRSVDAEPNLDRRVNILEEACRRYTQELQFQQSLRLVREQRDLVQSISTKARQYEEQSQFAEAIGQWKILRNIHPQYPGVDLEMGQLEKRREQQAQEEKKARLIDQIDHEMDNCAHAKALHLAGEALAEFPQDSELIILEKIARQNLERTQEAERLFEEARKLRSAGQLEEAAEFLQRALKFDERNPGMRNALIGLLVERANLLLEKDWRLAEPLCEAALSLDDQHPAVKRLRTLIAEAKRKDIVTECIAEARELHVSGDLPGALVRVGQGLSRYPDETRLIQYQTSLQASMEQQERRAQKLEPSKPPVEEQVSPRPVITPGTGFTDLYERSVVLPDSLARMTVIAPSEAGVSGELSFPRVLDVKPSRQTKLWGLGVAAAFIVGSTGVFLGVHHKRQPTTKPGAYRSMRYVEVPVTLAPADAQLVVDGTVNAERTLQLAADKKFVVSVSKIGYKLFAATGLSPNRQGWNFALAPEQMHLQVLTAEHSGRVFLDNHDIWNLQQGDMVDASLPADGVQHSLTARNQSGELFKVIFRALPGQIPELMPVTGREFVVSGLGNEAKVFTASSGASVSTSGMPPVGITTNGTRLDLTATDPDQTLLTTSGAEKQSILFPHGNAPVLLVSLHANSNLGSASIKTNIENAKLLFDGHERKSRRPGQWHISAAAGSHELEVMAEGYTTEKRLLKIENGQDLSQTIELARASAELVVQGGTGGAQVFIDDRPVGTIDSTNSLKLPIPPGQHQIELRNAGFESLTLTHTFESGRTFAINSSALKLFGTINFAVTPIPATVRYRRAGESNWHSGAVGSSVRVKAGKYEVLLKADGYEPSQQEFEVASGGVVEADWHLRPLPQTPTPRAVAESPKDRFQHPEELEEKPGPWLTGNSGRFLALRPAKKYTLTFLTPAAMPGRFNALTGKHRPKWNVVVRQFDGRHSLLQDAEIEYELEEHQLMRKVKVDGKVAKSKATADFADGQFAYTVDVLLQGDGIRTMTRDGKLLDQFTDNRFDWANPTVAIKGDTLFVVR